MGGVLQLEAHQDVKGSLSYLRSFRFDVWHVKLAIRLGFLPVYMIYNCK